MTILGVSGLLAYALCGCSSDTLLSIYNPSDIDRVGCVAEIDTAILPHSLVAGFIVADERGMEVPYQLTHDGKLLVQADVKAHESVKFRLKKATPTTSDTICIGQIRLDFQDDFTWENDRGGYRLYGPAYRKGGGNVSGYDIWTKSVDFPVLAQRYQDHCQKGISYHKDHGNGMDVYTVGPTLGAGMNALLEKDKMLLPCAYEKCEILDNGPLRTSAKITCYPLVAGGDSVVETRIITLDKGSWLNKTDIKYEGLSHDTPMVTGIVVHKQNRHGVSLDSDMRFISYADLTDNPDKGNGVIYIGVVNAIIPDSIVNSPLTPAVGDAIGHLLNHSVYTPGEVYTYYWGAGWSKGGVNGTQAWNQYLSDFHTMLAAPLEIKVK